MYFSISGAGPGLRSAAAAMVWLTAAAAVLCGGSAAFGAAPPPTRAAAPEFRYEVSRTATLRDVPGSQISVTGRKGTPIRLTAVNFRTGAEAPLISGENIGNTFVIRCAGPGLRPADEVGGYWATNIVPPVEHAVTAHLRWLLDPPADGAYQCKLMIGSYSTIVANGRVITMRIPAGAQLTEEKAPEARRWTLAAADRQVVAAGGRAEVLLSSAPVPSRGTAMEIVQDAAVSTCKANSSIAGCTGGSNAHPGSTLETQVAVRPVDAAGRPCGSVRLVPPHQISTAKHHLSLTHTVRVPLSQLAGCAQVGTALVVTHAGGNPVLIHSGLVNGHSASRGAAVVTGR